MYEQPDMQYHTVRDNIHSHPKVMEMLEHVANSDMYRLFFAKLMNNNVAALDTPTFRTMTHRMLIGGLVMVWSKAFQDGKQSPTNPEDIIMFDAGQHLIDALSGVPGTFDALKAVDWLSEETNESGERLLRFPRLMRYV